MSVEDEQAVCCVSVLIVRAVSFLHVGFSRERKASCDSGDHDLQHRHWRCSRPGSGIVHLCKQASS